MRYKADWLIDGQVLALTHFDPVVTAEDFASILSDTSNALESVNREFHVLIDNRIIRDTTVASLDMMLQAFPAMNHPQLRWIVMILPDSIKHQAHDMAIQQNGQIQLGYVDSLERAYQHFRRIDDSLNWDAIDSKFFEQS